MAFGQSGSGGGADPFSGTAERGAGSGGAGMGPSPALSAIKGYWESLRGGGAEVPARAAVDPCGMQEGLHCAFLGERVAPGVLRLRVAGGALCDLMGMELRGMPLSALIEPEGRARLAEVVENLLAAPAVADIALTSGAGFGRPALVGRLLMLPLCDHTGAVTRVLGGLDHRGDAGRSPRRFLPGQMRVARLGGAATAAGLAEAPASFQPMPAAARLRARGLAPRPRLVQDFAP